MRTIDLSQLPTPVLIELVTYENILDKRKKRFISLFPSEQQKVVASTLELESEPVTKLLEESAYLEMNLRQRINEAALANMVATAQGADLDNLAANYAINRLMINRGNPTAVPPVPPKFESDTDFRLRIQQAFEGLSTAGPKASYEFHALSADGRVADVCAISPSPACVTVSVLSREANGHASDDLISIVKSKVNDELVRPVADRVTVQSAEIIEYSIDSVVYLYPSPELEIILKAAEDKLVSYINEQRRIGRDIRLSAIYAALHVPGVQRVELKSPTKDIVISDTQASFCVDYKISLGGEDA